MSKEGIFYTKDNHKIVYNKLSGNDNYFIFLGGLMSDRKGSKALFFEDYCKKQGYSYIRFDYLGHGDSDLKFTDCNIDIWLENSIEIIENLTIGKVNLIGSSLGGWLIFLIAKKLPHKVKRLMGIAAAPDFTENLIWQKLSKTEQVNLQAGKIHNLAGCDDPHAGGTNKSETHKSETLTNDESTNNTLKNEPCYYPITMDLIASGRRNLILQPEQPLELSVPVTLIHGMKDIDVPYENSIKLAEQIKMPNNSPYQVKTLLLQDGDHRLSDQKSLAAIAHQLELL